MKKGLKFERLFTKAGKSPFDQFEWERREVIIKDYNTGSVVFIKRTSKSQKNGVNTLPIF